MTSYDQHSLVPLYKVIGIIFQTLFYGIYLCLVPISVYVMVTKGLQTRSRKWLLTFTTTMFVLSTMYWIASVIYTLLIINTWFSELHPATYNLPDWLPMFSAILLINYIITDGIVVWRAWVLCSDQTQYRPILMFPVVMLVINIFIYMLTVVVRASLLIIPRGVHIHRDFARTIDIAQVTNMVLSLLTNIFATSIISLKAWQYRELLMTSETGGQMPAQAMRILALLVESGMLYILIGVSAVASLVIRLPFGTLGDLFTPVSVQLAGMYPISILLLGDQNCLLNSTACYSSGAVLDTRGVQCSQMEPMSFASEPVLQVASGHQVDLVIKPPKTNIQVSFGSTFEPLAGAAEMNLNAGSSKAL